MKKINKVPILTVLAICSIFSFSGSLSALAAGPAAVDLLSASNFVILSKTGITDVPTSAITGNIGTSPITGAALGVTCAEVVGTIYSVDAAGPVPCSVINATLLNIAVSDMETAYTAAAGITGPTATELGAGNISGLTIAPGLYKWSTDVSIATDVTLSGSASDVWVFQIAGNLNIASGASVPAGIKVILSGGAQASNIFWQVGGVTGATLGTYATMNGNILSAKQIIIETGAVLNGRALAQTQVTLDANTVSIPTPVVPIQVASVIVSQIQTSTSAERRESNMASNSAATPAPAPAPAPVTLAYVPAYQFAYVPNMPSTGQGGEATMNWILILSALTLAAFGFSYMRKTV